MSSTASLWGTFDLALEGPRAGNPFRDVSLARCFRLAIARLRSPASTMEMAPTHPLHAGCPGGMVIRDDQQCPGAGRDRGAVRSARLIRTSWPGSCDPHHFRYADGTRFINIGTTAYVWNLQGDALEEQTLASLAKAPFTKIRMCVFPKHYRYNQNEPERYPFALVQQGKQVGRQHRWSRGWEFDFDAARSGLLPASRKTHQPARRDRRRGRPDHLPSLRPLGLFAHVAGAG